MIKKKTVKIDIEGIESIVCDVCKKEYKKGETDIDGEIQEFTHIAFTGGWGSIFGDGSHFSCDICQHCMKEKLGEYIREVKNDNG
jgi:hypothetical protein